MKLIITADIHLGSTVPGLDRFDILKQIFGSAKKKKVDYLVIAGDIYDHLMVSNLIRAKFNRMINDLSKDVKILIIPGNHDVGVKTTSLSPIKSFIGDRIRIIDNPKVLRMKGKKVLLLPFTRKMHTEKNHLLKVVKRYKGKYDFVFGHFSLIGAKVGPSNFSLISGITKSTLKEYIKSRHIILGHIHKPQTASNIIYCGSPDYLDFGERKEKKRFLYFNGKELESIPTKTKPLCQIELTKEGVIGDIIKGGIYKIVVRCRKDEVDGMDIASLSADVKEGGGKIIKISWEVESAPRKRAKKIDFRKSLKGNIKEYITNFSGKESRKEVLDLTKEVWNAAIKTRN
jgi:exonuclease SbcD